MHIKKLIESNKLDVSYHPKNCYKPPFSPFPVRSVHSEGSPLSVFLPALQEQLEVAVISNHRSQRWLFFLTPLCPPFYIFASFEQLFVILSSLKIFSKCWLFYAPNIFL